MRARILLLAALALCEVDAARAQTHLMYPQCGGHQSALMPVPMHVPVLTAAATPVVPPKTYNLDNFCTYFFADYLLLRPRDANIPYAQAFDGATDPATPIGPAAVLSLDYAMGFRAGGGFAIDDRSYIEGRFTYYDNHTQSNTGLPPGAPGTAVIRGLLVHQATPLADTDSLTAEGAYDIKFITGDVVWKNMLLQGPRYFAMYHLGAQAAHVEQNLTAIYQIDGTTTVTSEITFSGVGPRFGIEGEYHCKGGLFTYGRGFLNVLAGRWEADFLQVNELAGRQAESGIEDDRLVPITELELGIGWSSVGGCFRFSAGLQTITWFNAMTMTSWLDGATTDSLNDTTSSLGFDGFVGRLEFRW